MTPSSTKRGIINGEATLTAVWNSLSPSDKEAWLRGQGYSPDLAQLSIVYLGKEYKRLLTMFIEDINRAIYDLY